MDRPVIGQFVTATHLISKTRQGGYPEHIKTVWERIPIQVAGCFVGYRTVYEGYKEWEEEYGSYFVPTGHKEAWLLVDNPRQTHKYVLPEDCRIAKPRWSPEDPNLNPWPVLDRFMLLRDRLQQSGNCIICKADVLGLEHHPNCAVGMMEILYKHLERK